MVNFDSDVVAGDVFKHKLDDCTERFFKLVSNNSAQMSDKASVTSNERLIISDTGYTVNFLFESHRNVVTIIVVFSFLENLLWRTVRFSDRFV